VVRQDVVRDVCFATMAMMDSGVSRHASPSWIITRWVPCSSASLERSVPPSAAARTSQSRTSPCASSWQILKSYFAYYHRARTHLSLGKDAPEPRAVQPPSMGKIVELPEVGGLHHRYKRRAA